MYKICERSETKAIVFNYAAAKECVVACGGTELDAAALIADHLRRDRRSHRILRQIQRYHRCIRVAAQRI